jgi:RibD C-terminal domain
VTESGKSKAVGFAAFSANRKVSKGSHSSILRATRYTPQGESYCFRYGPSHYLLNDGLIDEIHFLISPVVLGDGTSIFSQKSLVPLILMDRN